MTPVELPGGLPVAFREGTPEDHDFIYSSWLHEHRERGDWPRRLGIPRCAWDEQDNMPFTLPCPCCRFSHRRYFDEHKKVIAKLLASAKVTVACNPADPWFVLGYIVWEPKNVLHWVHVKATFRWDPTAEEHPRLGTALLGQAFDTVDMGDVERVCQQVRCSHWTKAMKAMEDTWWLRYDPFLLEGK